MPSDLLTIGDSVALAAFILMDARTDKSVCAMLMLYTCIPRIIYTYRGVGAWA